MQPSNTSSTTQFLFIALATISLFDFAHADDGFNDSCAQLTQNLIDECAHDIAYNQDLNKKMADQARSHLYDRIAEGQAGDPELANTISNISSDSILNLNKAKTKCNSMSKGNPNFYQTERSDQDGRCISVCNQAEARAKQVNTRALSQINANRARCIREVKALEVPLDRGLASLQGGVAGGQAVDQASNNTAPSNNCPAGRYCDWRRSENIEDRREDEDADLHANGSMNGDFNDPGVWEDAQVPTWANHVK